MTREIHPLTPDRFTDFEAVLGRGGGGGCWCMYWIHPDAQSVTKGARGGSKAANKGLFRALVDAGPPPGVIGYDAGTAVAWARVTPRAALPGLKNARFFKAAGDDAGVWSISCFTVKSRHRGQGWTGALIAAAIPFARAGRDDPRSLCQRPAGPGQPRRRLSWPGLHLRARRFHRGRPPLAGKGADAAHTVR